MVAGFEPLDSFARQFLTQFSGRDHPGRSWTADAWLAEMLFAPAADYVRPVFDVPNPSVRGRARAARRATGIITASSKLSAAFAAHRDTLTALLPKQGQPGLDAAQRSCSRFTPIRCGISRSAAPCRSCCRTFVVRDTALAKAMNVPPGPGFRLPGDGAAPSRLPRLCVAAAAGAPAAPPPDVLARIGAQLRRLEVDKESRVLRVVPPQWAGQGHEWLSPWAVLQAGGGIARTVRLFAAWRRLGDAYRAGDADRLAAEWRAVLALSGAARQLAAAARTAL